MLARPSLLDGKHELAAVHAVLQVPTNSGGADAFVCVSPLFALQSTLLQMYRCQSGVELIEYLAVWGHCSGVQVIACHIASNHMMH